MPRRVLELKFKRRRRVGQPRRRWFYQLLEGDEGNELARSSKGKD
jgi:hypothetical protein